MVHFRRCVPTIYPIGNWKKKSKISDKITYVQHYNTESIHLYYFGIHSDNDHIIHKKASW